MNQDNESNTADKQLLGVQFDGGHKVIRFFRWYADTQRIMYDAYNCPADVFFDIEEYLPKIGLVRYPYGSTMYSSFINHDNYSAALADLFTWVQWGK